MKKTIILVTGALALVGTGAYLFFKNKKKKSDILEEKKPAITSETPVSTSPTSTTGVEPLLTPVVEQRELASKNAISYGIDDIILEQARAIVKKYTKISNPAGLANRASTKKAMDAKLKKIGYTYNEGKLTKIVN